MRKLNLSLLQCLQDEALDHFTILKRELANILYTPQTSLYLLDITKGAYIRDLLRPTCVNSHCRAFDVKRFYHKAICKNYSEKSFYF